MTATNLATEVVRLTKSYGDRTVLGGVDLTVLEGTVYAFLGPDGAGKTAIIMILANLLTPGGGEVGVAGFASGPGYRDKGRGFDAAALRPCRRS